VAKTLPHTRRRCATVAAARRVCTEVDIYINFSHAYSAQTVY
jgi:hypothetical protein